MGPWKHQNTIKAIEANTAVLRLFQAAHPWASPDPGVRDGGVQLPPALPDETRIRTVAARLERQATLYEEAVRFAS